MKTPFIRTFLVLVAAVSVRGQQVQSTSPNVQNEDSKSELRQIFARFDDGDEQALLEVANFPAEDAVPFLDRLLKFYRKESTEYQAVLAALASDPRFAVQLGDRLEAATGRGAVDDRAFELLSLMGTPKAQAVVAPYLFDFNRTAPNAHGITRTNAISAALALGRMALSDSPTRSRPESHKGKDFLAWQKWAIAKGFVPRSTKAEVPQWLIADTTPPAERPQAGTQFSPKSILTPEPSAKGAGTPTSTATPGVQEPSSEFPIIPVATLAAALVAVIAFLLRGKSQ